jgi:hypothetical protein
MGQSRSFPFQFRKFNREQCFLNDDPKRCIEAFVFNRDPISQAGSRLNIATYIKDESGRRCEVLYKGNNKTVESVSVKTQDRAHSEEVGQNFAVTRERIPQIEAKALRKLRHPSRSRRLRTFLDGSGRE